MRTRVAVATLGLLTASAMLAACGGSSLVTGDRYSISGALAELPYVAAGDGGVTVQTGDLDKATELAGTRRPSSDGDSASVVSWLKGFDGSVGIDFPAILGMQFLATGSVSKQIGFSGVNVRSFASVLGHDTSFTLERLTDKALLKKALPTYDGLRTTGDGEPGTVDKHLDPQGGPFVQIHAAAQQAHRVAFSPQADLIKDWLDSKGRSMSDNEPLADVAHALDGHDIYAADLYGGEFHNARVTPQALTEAGPLITADYDAAGVGASVKDDETHVFVSYHFTGDAEAASTQVEKVWKDGTSLETRAPISDLATFEDISVHDQVVTVEVQPRQDQPRVLWQMLQRFDTPFVQAES